MKNRGDGGERQSQRLGDDLATSVSVRHPVSPAWDRQLPFCRLCVPTGTLLLSVPHDGASGVTSGISSLPAATY